MKFGLADDIIRRIADVLRTHPRVSRGTIYGSRAKGTFRNGSDIDLTLEGDGLTQRDILGLAIDLDALDLPYLFDLSAFQSLKNPALKDHIRRVGQTFYARQEA